MSIKTFRKLPKTPQRDFRGGSRTAATTKMERFVIIVNGFKSLTIITKRCILDVLAALDPPLDFNKRFSEVYFVRFEMTQL